MNNFLSSAIDIAEDDKSRSNYARKLIQSSPAVVPPPSVSPQPIPKVIVQYWDNCIPEDVQECLATWTSLEQLGFHRVLFDDSAARCFISAELGSPYVDAFNLCYHPAMRCDYFRLCYILFNGGFYVDADEMYRGVNVDHLFSDTRLKVQPLCYDILTGAMIAPEMFLSDRHNSREWIFYFNNNPIISPPRHAVIQLALERATQILISSSERPEIQATTGPGNLTASLVNHAVSSLRSRD